MQLRTLRYFQELARSSSLRKASERLLVAPGAISRQMELLEHFLQVKLFERGPKGVKLTVEGEFLAERIDVMMREFDQVRMLIADRQNMLAGTVCIYASEGIVSGLLAPVLASFSKQHPNIQFKIVIASAGRTIEAVCSGEADIGVGFYLPQRSDVNVRAQCEIWHRVLVAKGHPIAQKSSVTLADLVDEPLALPDSDFGVRQALDRVSKNQKISIQPRFVTSSLETQKALARMGVAILIQPDFGPDEVLTEHGLHTVPIEDPELQRVRVEACVYRYRPSSRAVTELIRMLEEVMAACNADAREKAGRR